MAFGEEYGGSMGTGVCIRCDSDDTTLRGLQRTGTRIIVCHNVCNKCHRVQFVGFTTTEEIAHQAVKKRLERALERATTPSQQRKITAALEYMQQTKALSELGL